MPENEGGTATLDAPAVDAATTTESVAPAVAAAPASAATDTPEPDTDAPATTDADDEEAPKGPPRGEDGKFATDYSKVTLPKDSAIDPAVLERTVAIARDRGLSVKDAQAMTDLVSQEIASTRADLMAAHQPGGAEWTKQLDAWKAQTLADPSLGKTPDERKASIELGASVLKRYAAAEPAESEGIMSFLNDSGLGEHPAVAKFFRWIGKSAGERPLSNGNGNGPAKSLVDIFYPKGAQRTAAEIAADP